MKQIIFGEECPDTAAAVLDVLRPAALESPDISDVGQFILMRAAGHLWFNPNAELLFEQQLWAEAEANKKMDKSSVELV